MSLFGFKFGSEGGGGSSILGSYVFLTRLMQSEGVGHAYRSWRREWRGKGKEYVSCLGLSCHWLNRLFASVEGQSCGN